MHDLAEGEVADHVYRRDDLEHRQLRDQRQRMRCQRERGQPGRGALDCHVLEDRTIRVLRQSIGC